MIPPRLQALRRLLPSRTGHKLSCRSLTALPDQQNNHSFAKRWKESADTVIIGGGVSGCSIAYHLAKMSNQDVVLLEKSELTAGSTWHAAGLTTTYHPGINVKQLHWYSMNFYPEIEKESGQQIGLHQPGSIRLATNNVRMDELHYQMSRQGWNSAPQCIVTPEEIKELAPIVDVDGANILGGLYTPYDGHVDPYSLTQAIAIAARKRGAQIYQGAEVTALECRSDGTWDVTTPMGTIHAKRIVNAAGFWAKELSNLHDLDLPLVPANHQYLVTKSVPEVQQLKREIPVLRHLEGSFYLRQERDGLLIGPYESEETMQLREDWTRDRVTPGFGKELFEPDLDRLQPHLEVAMELTPCFQTAEIQSVVHGPITYTPDVLPMIGPTRVPNLWLAVGFAYGIVHGGGAGKYLSDWILNGEAPFDLTELDPLRYGKWTTTDYSLAKARESYGWNSAVTFPHEERPAARPTYRVSGIHEELVKAGAFMGFHTGWEQPDWFAEPGQRPEYRPSFYRTNWHDALDREHSLVTSKVGLIDLTPFAKLKLTGPDNRKFLDRVVSGHVPKVGRTSIAHALTPKGKVYAEFTITAMEDGSFMVVTGSGSELHDLRHLEQVARDEAFDVNIANVSDDLGVLSIAGPNAKELLAKVTKEDVDQWKFLDAKECQVGGVNCLAIRISYTGELGWEFYLKLSEMKTLYQELMENGKDLGIGHFGTFTLNALRLEKGFKMWGSEMNCDNTVLDAGLDGFVRWKKQTDFIGRAHLESIRDDWRPTECVMMEVDVDDAYPEGNESVWCGKRVVGNTTSGSFSPALGKGLVFAYVPKILGTPGIEVDVEIMGKMRKARVLEGPPVLTQPMRARLEKKK